MLSPSGEAVIITENRTVPSTPDADEGPVSLPASLSSRPPMGSPEGTVKSTVEAVSTVLLFWIPMEETIPCFLSFPEPLGGYSAAPGPKNTQLEDQSLAAPRPQSASVGPERPDLVTWARGLALGSLSFSLLVLSF